MKKLFSEIIICLFCSISFTSFLGVQHLGAQSVKVLRIGSDIQDDVAVSRGIHRLSEIVSKQTQGRIKIEYYPTNQLGTSEEQISGTRMGTQEGWFGANGQMARLLSTFQLVSPPFAYKDKEARLAVEGSPFFDKVRAELRQKYGMVILFYDWFRGYRQLYTKRPVRKIEDLKGLKLRVPPSPARILAWQRLGASPTPVASGEMYMALKEGVVDGIELEELDLHAAHIDEVAKYATLTSHDAIFVSVAINKKFWESLTPEDRKILQAAAVEAREYVDQISPEMVKRTFEISRKEEKVEFISLTAAQREEFLKVGQQVLDELEATKKWWPQGTVAKIRARDPFYFKK